MNIKIDSVNKEFSAFAGLKIFDELKKKIYHPANFDKKCLPCDKKGDTSSSYSKFSDLLHGFIAGADCLDDMGKLGQDGGFKAIAGNTVFTPKSYGDYLRSFNEMNCQQLNFNLGRSAYTLRSRLYESANSILFDIDSTSNQQYGKKMEGVEMNYKGIHCLDTIQVFDEYGFQYWNEVRSGSTNTAKNAPYIIQSVLNQLPNNRPKVTVRADSGYCNFGFFHACAAKGAEFVVCLRKLMLAPLLGKINNWEKQDETDAERIIFKDGSECEIGETSYSPKQSHIKFRVIVIRALKPGAENKMFLALDDYSYQAWISTISDSSSALEIIKLYRKRGNAENFVKELKNGLDLHHYPCKKLLANNAYGLIAAYAYNLMRFISLKDTPEKPKFAKAIRFGFVHIPCQVVRHARSVTFRFADFYFKEVRKWVQEIATLKISIPIGANH